ncbi:class I SAM-dependent methyltransferase [Methanosphaera sp.]
MNDKSYWEQYYKENPNPVEPSTFAKFIRGFLNPDKSLIELGCGNGRDSVFFAKNNLKVTAIDQVETEMDYLNHKYSLYNLDFKADDFTNLGTENKYDYVYSRFTLHSITEEAEARVLKWIGSQLNENGLFFLEVRSIKDPMFDKGEKISDNENVTTHYRRYLDFEDTIEKLEKNGLSIIYKLESQGLAVYKDDDPMLIRIVSKKE